MVDFVKKYNVKNVTVRFVSHLYIDIQIENG